MWMMSLGTRPTMSPDVVLDVAAAYKVHDAVAQPNGCDIHGEFSKMNFVPIS